MTTTGFVKNSHLNTLQMLDMEKEATTTTTKILSEAEDTANFVPTTTRRSIPTISRPSSISNRRTNGDDAGGIIDDEEEERGGGENSSRINVTSRRTRRRMPKKPKKWRCFYHHFLLPRPPSSSSSSSLLPPPVFSAPPTSQQLPSLMRRSNKRTQMIVLVEDEETAAADGGGIVLETRAEAAKAEAAAAPTTDMDLRRRKTASTGGRTTKMVMTKNIGNRRSRTLIMLVNLVVLFCYIMTTGFCNATQQQQQHGDPTPPIPNSPKSAGDHRRIVVDADLDTGSRRRGNSNYHRRLYTNQWAVEIAGGTESQAELIARRHGFEYLGRVVGDYYLFAAAGNRMRRKRSTRRARYLQYELGREPKVIWLEQQVAKRRVKRDFIYPNNYYDHPPPRAPVGAGASLPRSSRTVRQSSSSGGSKPPNPPPPPAPPINNVGITPYFYNNNSTGRKVIWISIDRHHHHRALIVVGGRQQISNNTTAVGGNHRLHLRHLRVTLIRRITIETCKRSIARNRP